MARCLRRLVSLFVLAVAVWGAGFAAAAGHGAGHIAGQAFELGTGAWSWFGGPRAIHLDAQFNRTYTGWMTEHGEVVVASFDHTTHEVQSAIVKTGFRVDDHSNPALLALDDGRIMVFYAQHGKCPTFYRVSTRPEDVTSWGPERVIRSQVHGPHGCAYPNPVQLSAEQNRIYLFARCANWHPCMSWSDDSVHWVHTRPYLDVHVANQRPYVKVASDGRDTVYLAFTDGHPYRFRTSIYFAEYHDGGFYRADGRLITTVQHAPFFPRQADIVYDQRTARARSWVHDVAVDKQGRPIIVFARFFSRFDHRYIYARWNGHGWVKHQIVRAGASISTIPEEPYYSGGVSLNHRDPSEVYVSRDVGTHRWEIERWHTPDGGATWTMEPVTSGSSVNNVRPITALGVRGGDVILWMRGVYRWYRDFNTQIWMTLLPAMPDGSAPGTPKRAGGAVAPGRTAPAPRESRGISEGD